MEPENSQVHLTTTIANTVQFAKLANCLTEKDTSMFSARQLIYSLICQEKKKKSCVPSTEVGETIQV
jgi:hypothetical protein